MTRRGKTMWPTLALVSSLAFLGYGYYLYNELTQKYRVSEIRVEKLERRHSSMKSQLQVVYEHRAKLEGTLTKERQEHSVAKQDLLTKLKEYDNNLTRTRHEAFNRFNALDTQHKMLKAQHEELAADYSRMQQQYVRLGDDHGRVVTNLKEDYRKLKEAKEKESKALQERVQELYNENEFLRSDLRHYQKTYEEEKEEKERFSRTIKRLMAQIRKLEKTSKDCVEDLHNTQKEKNDIYAALKVLKQKTAQLRSGLQAKERRHEQGGESESTKRAPNVRATKSSIKRTTKKVTLAPTTPRIRTVFNTVKEKRVDNEIPRAPKKRTGNKKRDEYRMRGLMIGKGDTKGDAMDNQYERQSSKQGSLMGNNLNDNENKGQQKETDFQQLVDKAEMFGGTYDQEEQRAKERGVATEEPQAGGTVHSFMKSTQETTGEGIRLQGHTGEGTGNNTHNRSQYKSGIKEVVETKAGESREKEGGNKKNDEGVDSAGKQFLRKQLHLQLHERQIRSKDNEGDKTIISDNRSKQSERRTGATVNVTNKPSSNSEGGRKFVTAKSSMYEETKHGASTNEKVKEVKVLGNRRQLQPPRSIAKNNEGSDKLLSVDGNKPDMRVKDQFTTPRRSHVVRGKAAFPSSEAKRTFGHERGLAEKAVREQRRLPNETYGDEIPSAVKPPKIPMEVRKDRTNLTPTKIAVPTVAKSTVKGIQSRHSYLDTTSRNKRERKKRRKEAEDDVEEELDENNIVAAVGDKIQEKQRIEPEIQDERDDTLDQDADDKEQLKDKDSVLSKPLKAVERKVAEEGLDEKRTPTDVITLKPGATHVETPPVVDKLSETFEDDEHGDQVLDDDINQERQNEIETDKTKQEGLSNLPSEDLQRSSENDQGNTQENDDQELGEPVNNMIVDGKENIDDENQEPLENEENNN